MIVILNETTLVNAALHQDWLQWMQDIQVPAILGTGCFYQHQLVRILNNEDMDGESYAVQYYAESMEKYKQWQELYSESFRATAAAKWGAEALSFSTLMELVL